MSSTNEEDVPPNITKELNEEDELSNLLKELNKEIAKTGICAWLEPTAICLLMGLLVLSLLVPRVKERSFLKVSYWKWSMLGLVILVGRFVSRLILWVILHLLELNRFCRLRILFYATIVKGTLRKLIWSAIIFLVLYFLIYHIVGIETEQTRGTYLMLSILGLVVGCLSWLMVSVLLKVHEIKYYIKFYFDRVRKSILEEYVIRMLLDSPECHNKETSKINDLSQLNHESVRARIMDMMINIIKQGSLPSTEEVGDIDKPVEEAVTTKILQNYIILKSNSTHAENTKTYLSEQCAISIDVFEGDHINEETLHLWVVTVYGDRHTLLSDLKEANIFLKKQYQVVKIVVGVLTLNSWLLLLEFDKLQVSLLAGVEALVGVCWSLYGPNPN